MGMTRVKGAVWEGDEQGTVNLASGEAYQIGGVQVVGEQGAAESDPGAVTPYTPHSTGAVPVTSNAATDLDTTAAALATLEDEVAALRVTVVSLLAKLRTHGLIAS